MSSSFYQKGTFLRARHQRTLIKGATGGHIMTTVNNTKERKSANDRKAFFQPCCAPSPPPLLPHLCRSSTTSNLALLPTSTSHSPHFLQTPTKHPTPLPTLPPCSRTPQTCFNASISASSLPASPPISLANLYTHCSQSLAPSKPVIGAMAAVLPVRAGG